ncbi:MAG: glucosaminidase domain-containing protein [Bacteroidota bacterium]
MTGPSRPKYLAPLITFLLLFGCSEEKKRVLEPVLAEVIDVNDIIPITDSLVAPILYKNIGGFDTLTVQENKEKFIATILPAILIVKYRIRQDLIKIKSLISEDYWYPEDSSFYLMQLKRFNASDSSDLIVRMHTHPNSIVLAQAAVESGWGTSRFFSQANNLFGIWSYNPDRPRIAARSGNRTIHLRKYDDIAASIMDYFETIARARAYRSFREARMQTDDVDELLPYLRSYSERKSEYVDQLRVIINHNNFKQYDHYQLDPQYFILQ